MLKELTIHNFQSHTISKLNLDKGVNAIVGLSDSGKTAILRALYWAIFNQPSGSAFVRHGEEDCFVQMLFDDVQVDRIRTSNRNGYDVDNEEYNALGKGTVPAQVQTALCLDNINFRQQMDGPFLLSMTPGEIARYLNDIVDLGEIDDTFKNIHSMQRSCSADIRIYEKLLQENQEQLDKLDNLNEYIEEVEKAANCWTILQSNEEKQSRLTALLDQIRETEDKIQTYSWVDDVESIDPSPLIEVEIKISKLLSLIASIEDINKEVSDLEEFSSEGEDIAALLQENKSITVRVSHLQNIICLLNGASEKEAEAEQKVSSLEEQHKKLSKQIKVCPTCKRPL